ncbi:MAG: SDR family oxidoreductase [Acidobacteria bacterium]|nr:SDR family oxidoreductase [Acidobacteriota bacterium]
MQETKLAGLVAVITGASSGIGRAVAVDLAEAGVRLLLTARRAERLSTLASELGGLAIAGDMTDPDLPAQLLEKALAAYGRCDIVLNNAGTIEVGSIASIDIEKVCGMVRVNVEAAYRVAYVFARHFQQQNRGSLVNMSSVMATKVRPTAGAYAGTKYAIEALSEAFRMELAGTGVQVISVEPGLVLTELHDKWPVHPSKSLNIPNPLKPEDVARCVRFALTQPENVRIPRLMILPHEHQI